MLKMLNATQTVGRFIANTSVPRILLAGFSIRLVLILYSIIHDNSSFDVKYTDIDYHVFTNGSEAILRGQSPYTDTEYRYTPLVAWIFTPNILISEHAGKLLLVIADIVGGNLIHRINIHQGTTRARSKLFLCLWLFNPVNIAISTRGSFEPILTLLILTAIHLLISNQHVLSGLLLGLAIHIKLYPIIYVIAFYGYLVQRKPYIKTKTKLMYWIQTLSPNIDHIQFYTSCAVSLAATTYVSYVYYGDTFIEQTITYHLKRKDLQHNFSFYFYLFRQLPDYQNLLSRAAFVVQAIGVLAISLLYLSIDINPRVKLKKLNFSLFMTTFYFVSFNKVCTSQYFNWYLIFIPLIADNVRLTPGQALMIAVRWFAAQAHWLMLAYLYEFKKLDVLGQVGISSLLFLVCNVHIMSVLYHKFDANPRKQDSDADSKSA